MCISAAIFAHNCFPIRNESNRRNSSDALNTIAKMSALRCSRYIRHFHRSFTFSYKQFSSSSPQFFVDRLINPVASSFHAAASIARQEWGGVRYMAAAVVRGGKGRGNAEASMRLQEWDRVRFMATTAAARGGKGRVNMKVDIGARARRNQNRRLWAYGLSFSAVAGFIIVVLGSFQEYLVFYVTPTDAMEKFTKDPSKSKFRLGGLVVEGSLMQPASSMETEFVVTDLVTDILVRYKGSLPDLFREGHSIVAEGFIRPWSSESTTVTPFSSGRSVTEKARANGCYFSAIEVLAKHDEKYMPKEVAAAIEKNRAAIEAANSSSQEQLQS